jgi:hypothetical protein
MRSIRAHLSMMSHGQRRTIERASSNNLFVIVDHSSSVRFEHAYLLPVP